MTVIVAASRRAYNDNAWIRVGGSLLRRCHVLDFSRTGARLTITNADRIPDKFTLILSKYGSGNTARVKWRRHTQIGAEVHSRSANNRPPASSPKCTYDRPQWSNTTGA